MTDTAVTRDNEASRYEIRVDDTLAGFAEFQKRPGEILFTHTEVDPAFTGKGLGSILASEALADAVAAGLTIVPYCPYIARYLETHEVAGAQIRWPQKPDQRSNWRHPCRVSRACPVARKYGAGTGSRPAARSRWRAAAIQDDAA